MNDKINETDFVNALEEKNILIISMGNGKLRMVTHMDFTDQMLEKVIDVLNSLVI